MLAAPQEIWSYITDQPKRKKKTLGRDPRKKGQLRLSTVRKTQTHEVQSVGAHLAGEPPPGQHQKDERRNSPPIRPRHT